MRSLLFQRHRNLGVNSPALVGSTMTYDMALLGSGPSACALAIYSSRAGMRTVLISRPGAQRSFVSPETIPGAVRGHLDTLGLAAHIRDFVVARQYQMSSAWGSNEVTTRNSIFDADGAGYLVNRRSFDDLLLSNALKEPGVSLKAGTVRTVARRGNAWDIQLDSGSQELKAAVLVDASGRNASLARILGFRRLWLDRQVCIQTEAVSQSLSDNDVLVESSPDGWWFSAPISEQLISLCWFTDRSLARRTICSQESFITHLKLAPHTSKRIRALEAWRPRCSAAGTSILPTFGSEGWIAIGDAALACDPLSSQGVITALVSAHAALTAIRDYLSGLGNGLQQYHSFQRETARRLLRQRQYFYDLETRWHSGSFWASRALTFSNLAL